MISRSRTQTSNDASESAAAGRYIPDYRLAMHSGLNDELAEIVARICNLDEGKSRDRAESGNLFRKALHCCARGADPQLELRHTPGHHDGNRARKTLMGLAFQFGNIEAIRQLAGQGVRVEPFMMSELFNTAAEDQRLAVIRTGLELGADPTEKFTDRSGLETSLALRAAGVADGAAAHLMMDHGFHLDGHFLTTFLCRHESWFEGVEKSAIAASLIDRVLREIRNQKVRQSSAQLAAIFAAQYGNLETALVLLNRHQVDINEPRARDLPSVLGAAARFGQIELLEILLKRPGVNLNPPADRGPLPIQWAILSDQCAVVNLLVEHGAKIPQGPVLTQQGATMSFKAFCGRYAKSPAMKSLVNALLARSRLQANALMARNRLKASGVTPSSNVRRKPIP